QWFSLVANLEKLHRREGLDLVVIDALATLLPGYAENYAPKLLDCLLPLQELANLGPAVWLMHHPAKGKCADGQAGRGSSALGAFADIPMEMKCCRRAGSRDGSTSSPSGCLRKPQAGWTRARLSQTS